MSSGNDVQRGHQEPVRVDAGTQALATVSSMQRPLRSIPPSAFENLLLVTARSPAEVERELDEMGVDHAGVGVIPISGSPVEYAGKLVTTAAIAPDDLTGVSMRYATGLDVLSPGRGWVLIDSLDVFLLSADEERVVRLLDHVTGRARDRDVRGVYTVVRDAIDDRTYARLRRRFDAEVDLR